MHWLAGQGLNTALEDGAVLGWHVQEHGLTAEALREFEKERIPRVCKIAEQESVRHCPSSPMQLEIMMRHPQF